MISFLRFRRKDKTALQDGQPPQVGRCGEALARRHLEDLGFRILACNYRSPLGEIDLIAEEAGTLVFIEVKTRTSGSHGHPAEAVTERKQRQLIKVAMEYLNRERIDNRALRFDVVAVLFGAGGPAEIEVIRNAFELKEW